MDKPFCEKIYELRRTNNLTQIQLGKKLGVSGQAVSKWERGTNMPDAMMLYKICNVFGVTSEWLLGEDSVSSSNDIMQNFCNYARAQGKTKTVIDTISRLSRDSNKSIKGSSAFFSSAQTLVSFDSGMGFVLSGNEFVNKCFDMKHENIVKLLGVFNNKACFEVMKILPVDDDITQEEIAERLGYDDATVDKVLFELMKRELICVTTDKNGVLGYMQSQNMMGILMILSGCFIACGQQIGWLKVSRGI